MHWPNADEQEMRAFKNHSISGLCTFNPNLSLQLWERLSDQANNSLNLTHKSIINTNLSSDEQLFVVFKYNCTPFETTGKRILVH